MKLTALFGLLAWAGVSHAATLYNNGPVVDGTGVSILTAPSTTLGFASVAASAFTVADDFVVPVGQSWLVASLDFYAYQTNAVGFTFTTATWSVVRGADANTGTVVASGATAVTNGGLVGYRASSTTPTNTARAIYRSSADVVDFSIGAGQYWLTWALAGTAASGPFVPPTADAAPGNAAQSAGTGYAALADAGSGVTIALPFTINGTITAVPEPTRLAMMLAGGLALLGAARRRAAR